MKKKENDLLNFTDSGGKKPVIIFLHFFGGSSRSWREVIKILQNKYRCIAVDMRGFGKSLQDLNNFSAHDRVKDLMNVISFLRLKNFTVVGHSMGGKIAMALAAEQSAGLNALILLAPSPLSPEPFKIGERMKLRNAYGDIEAIKTSLISATGIKPGNDAFNEAVEDNLSASQKAWDHWLNIGSKENIAQKIKMINCPVLVLSGEKDKKLPAAFLKKKIIKKLPGSVIKQIAKAGHLLPLEVPQIACKEIDQFLTGK